MLTLIYGLIAFSTIVGLLVWFVVSLCLFISAKRQNKANPDAVSKSSLITRTVMLIISSVFLGILILVVIGFIALMYMALAYM